MSNDNDDRIWVKDIDGYVYPDMIARENERQCEEEDRQAEFDEVGEISLFNGKAISPDFLNGRGINLYEWRWAIHQAENALRHPTSGQHLERTLVRSLVSLGRSYAIARYAKWEQVPYPSAQTASLPLGIKALLSQYLIGQGIRSPQRFNDRVRAAFHAATGLTDVTAYRRTTTVQLLIHEIAQESNDRGGAETLDREATRAMLSLARLHFSVSEINFDSFADMAKLSAIYSREADTKRSGKDEAQRIARGNIRNWRMRHLRPLTDLFPFAVRKGLERGIDQFGLGRDLSREIAVNELALAHCGVLLMRKSAYWNAAVRTRNRESD